jgi:RNA polymerase sigma-70 factor (ECF subfamily)
MGADMEIIEQVAAGDEQAFRELTEPYRRELQAHCYRMLGSIQDAEDVLQETLLAAWRGVAAFEGRSSVRTWLYRIATNRCLNALRDNARHRREIVQPAYALPEPSRIGEPSWLEPYPDVLFEGMPDAAPGPDARYEAKESISLAFVAAVQSLPPRQRAVLLLRDVLGYRAAQVADLLGVTEEAVTSALKRARAAMPRPVSISYGPQELAAAGRFAEAFERGDIAALVELLTDDVQLTMPPLPLEYIGREATGNFLATIAFRNQRQYRLFATGANGQPAYGVYLTEPYAPVFHAHGVVILACAGGQVSAMTRFLDNGLLAHFGLPRILPDVRFD